VTHSVDSLNERKICWLATVRPDGRAHLTPIWFVWVDASFWVCCNDATVKARNMRANPSVAISLEDGADPLVIEGNAVLHQRPYPAEVIAAFQAKFDWNISGDEPDPDGDFGTLAQVRPIKWVMNGIRASEPSASEPSAGDTAP
jgi:hypothetical protein